MYANNQSTQTTQQTTTAPTTATQPIHPILKSLWSIPHILRIPDPLPPLDAIRKLIQNRITELTASPHFHDNNFTCNSDAAILQDKLAQLQKHFPLAEPPTHAEPNSGPPSASHSPSNQALMSVQKPSTNLPPKNSLPTESTIGSQHNPTESNPSSAESVPSSAEFSPSSAESKLASTESDSAIPQPLPSANLEDLTLQKHLQTAALQPPVDLRQYLSGRSPLDNLTSQQQETILLLLEDYPAWRVAQIIAQPPPLGFGLKTTDSSLNHFRGRLLAARCQALRDQNEKALADLFAQAHQSDQAFQNALQGIIKDRLMRAATQPHFSLGVLDSMITSLNKLRKQALAERKQTHAEKSK